MNDLTIKTSTELAVTTRWIQCFNDKSNDTVLTLIEKESELSVKKCLNYPSLKKLTETVSKKEILLAIQKAVLITAQSFKYSEKIDNSQTALLAIDLYDLLEHESLEDIFLMLKLGRQGKLGSTKGKLDHETVFNLFVPAYLELKAQEREKDVHNEKVNFVQDKQYKISAENKEKLNKLIEQLDKKISVKEPCVQVVNSYDAFLENLPATCKFLSDKELEKEMQKAVDFRLHEAYTIYKAEHEVRKQTKK